MKNIGKVDKIVRIVLGVALLSLMFLADGGFKYLGLIGLIPLVTAFVGFCPLYALFHLHTNKG